MIGRFLRFTAVVSTATLLSCCANDVASAKAIRVEYGTVEAIEIHRAADDKPVNAGTVLGGVAGGLIGHQIGRGRGNTAATIAGAIGGAVVGHEVEKKVNGSRYRITVHLDTGSTLIVDESGEVDLRVGDRVRVEDDRVSRL